MFLLFFKKCYNYKNTIYCCLFKRKCDGFVTLFSVLVVGAVGVIIVTSMLLLGTSFTRTGIVYEQSTQAKALANACAEEALEQIRDSSPFTGSATITMGNGSCGYTVTSQGAQDRTVTASSTVGTVVRKVKVIINKITPAIIVVSWQEVLDF